MESAKHYGVPLDGHNCNRNHPHAMREEYVPQDSTNCSCTASQNPPRRISAKRTDGIRNAAVAEKQCQKYRSPPPQVRLGLCKKEVSLGRPKARAGYLSSP